MQLLNALILGIIQGLTEFIPVSSSGHLILTGHLLNFDGGLVFDVALHIGTLGALLLFFRRDIWELAVSLVKRNEQTKLAYILILATIPAVILGVALESKVAQVFRSDSLVAVNLIVVAIVLLAADKWGKQIRNLDDMTAKKGLGIGLAQALAIIPGVSRSGITISAGLLAGFDRVSATRFSFLMSVPIIAGAIAKVMIDRSSLSQVAAEPTVFLVGIIASLVSGYLAIKFLLSYLSRHGLAIFGYYRIALGVLILTIGAYR